jgi:hypothetical protein
LRRNPPATIRTTAPLAFGKDVLCVQLHRLDPVIGFGLRADASVTRITLGGNSVDLPDERRDRRRLGADS